MPIYEQKSRGETLFPTKRMISVIWKYFGFYKGNEQLWIQYVLQSVSHNKRQYHEPLPKYKELQTTVEQI